MGKRRKKHKVRHQSKARGRAADPALTRPGDGSTDLEISGLVKALEEKRGRRAVAIAKRLLKNRPLLADELQRVVEAYELRLMELLRDGYRTEAFTFYNDTITRRPEWKTLFSADIRIYLECLGLSSDILPKYGVDTTATEQITTSIRRTLHDPRILLDNRRLPADSPLRREAALILSVWERIEAAEGIREVSDQLTAISRRSPFAHWRLFLQALAALYASDDAMVLANLQRIPQDSAVQKGAALIRDLMSRNRPRSRAGATLFDAVFKDDLKHRLTAVDRLIRDGNYQNAATETRTLTRLIQQCGRQQLAYDLVSSVILKSMPDEPLDYSRAWREFQNLLDDGYPMVMRVRHRWGMASDGDWLDYLESNPGRFAKLEKAMIYRECALAAISELTRERGLLDGQRVPRAQRKEIENYFRRSVTAKPLRECYQSWYETALAFKWKTNAILEQWHRDFPRDETPLYEMLIEARKRRKVTKVQRYYDRLRALVGNSPRLMQMKPFIAAERAIIGMQRRESSDLEAALNDVPDHPEVMAVVRHCLFWLNASGLTTRRKAEASLEDRQQPYLILYCLDTIRPRSKWYDNLPKSVKHQFKNPDLVMNSLIAALEIDDIVWRVSDLPWYPPLDAALSECAWPGNLLARLLHALYRRYPSLTDGTAIRIVLRSTADGLKKQCLARSDLLCYRALAYHAISQKQPRCGFMAVVAVANLLSIAKYDLRRGAGDQRLYDEVIQCLPNESELEDADDWTEKSVTDFIIRESQLQTIDDVLRCSFNVSAGFGRRCGSSAPGFHDADDLERDIASLLNLVGEYEELFGPDDELADLINPLRPPGRRGRGARSRRRRSSADDNPPFF